MKSHPEVIHSCTSTQGVSNSRRPLEKLHELLPDCEKASGPPQYLQFTEWMEFIYGKEEHDSFNSRMEGKNPPQPKQVPKTAPVARSSNSNVRKHPQDQNKIKVKAPATKPYIQGYIIPEIQQNSL
ncbi:hypothetical protein O181_016504 [Austropuccinia psidii MF-1]|uniref:Uncharacterized protein n=1 Tax=Austropuccinia psidii MF-1 TaxID=1389203 RepID=A0A9Q3C1U2_9BASI|nr:hypothetical protein [Austropuccinia psidii MF-1]